MPHVPKRAPSESIKRRRGLDWILIVFELIRPAEVNQAVLPGGKFAAVFTHDMNLAEDRSTHCSRMSGPGSGVDSYESVALGTGVVLVNDRAEPVEHLMFNLHRTRRGGVENAFKGR